MKTDTPGSFSKEKSFTRCTIARVVVILDSTKVGLNRSVTMGGSDDLSYKGGSNRQLLPTISEARDV